MPKFSCTDGNADMTIEADTAQEAAQAYVDDGEWGKIASTEWVTIAVTPDTGAMETQLAALIGDRQMTDHISGWWVFEASDLDLAPLRAALPDCTLRLDAAGDLDVDHGGHERFTIAIEPEVPACCGGHDHDWQSPYEVLGGLKDNPGVQGHGGGVIIKEVCIHCGGYKVVDTWAQRGDTGEQGLTSVSYEEADGASLKWLAAEQLETALDANPEVYGYDTASREMDDYTVTLTDAAIRKGEFDPETGDEEHGAAWLCAIDALKQLKSSLPALPSGVDYRLELDDEERDVIHLRIEV